MSYMLASHEEDIANEWKKYKGYTVRPLPSTLSYYHHVIKSLHPHNRCLLYGGTPEIRNIFHELNLNTVIVDQSEKMVSAMGLLTDGAASLLKNETMVCANWLSMPSFEEPFDLLIGDDAINMVTWDQFPAFLENAHQCLREDGLFLCHLLVKPDDTLIHQGIVDVLTDYQHGQIKSPYDLASRLNFLCFDQNDYSMGWQKTIQQLGDQLNHFKPEFDFVELFKYCNSQFYCPPQRTFEKLVQDYFSIVEIFYPHEHDYCLFEPVYLLKKRRRS